jgi:hypothetical protein
VPSQEEDEASQEALQETPAVPAGAEPIAQERLGGSVPQAQTQRQRKRRHPGARGQEAQEEG